MSLKTLGPLLTLRPLELSQAQGLRPLELLQALGPLELTLTLCPLELLQALGLRLTQRPPQRLYAAQRPRQPAFVP